MNWWKFHEPLYEWGLGFTLGLGMMEYVSGIWLVFSGMQRILIFIKIELNKLIVVNMSKCLPTLGSGGFRVIVGARNLGRT